MDSAKILHRIKMATTWVFRIDLFLGVIVGIMVLTPWLDLKVNVLPEVSATVGENRPETASSIGPSEIAERTLGKSIFRTSREVKAQAVDEIGRYKLVGISGSPGSYKAYFRDEKLKRTESKTKGEAIGPFTVIEIEREKVLVERGNERFEFVR